MASSRESRARNGGVNTMRHSTTMILVACTCVLGMGTTAAQGGVQPILVDRDHDGSISLIEAAPDRMISSLFVDLDRNQDGKLDVIELSRLQQAERDRDLMLARSACKALR